MLKALQRRINVEIKIEEIEGGSFKERLKEWRMEDWKMGDVEIDEWEKLLLSDSDIDL